MSDGIPGRSRRYKGRLPETDDRIRHCETEGCPTILSRYNVGTTCFRHRPIRYPKVRGRFTGED